MNAIYARQSVDRADSISIESQIEFCRYELKGEPYKVYADRGYSGKNTDRPAFGEMMRNHPQGHCVQAGSHQPLHSRFFPDDGAV